MNKKASIILLSSTVFTLFLGCISSVFAWIIPNERFHFDDANGYTASAYFGGGDGSSDDPYIISQPMHLYNLAWLQYLGEFNSDTPITQYHFIVTEDLDMTNYVLPPIGTQINPFFHEFNGGGHVISNLTTSNHIGDGQIVKHPLSVTQVNDVDIVGFFGVIGDYKSYTASSLTPLVYDFKLDNSNVVAYNNKALIGIAAGYINGEVSGVGVINSNISLSNSSVTYLDSSITNNISDYTLVGYCKSEYRNEVKITDTEVYMPNIVEFLVDHDENGGDESGSGGSIPMSEIFTRTKTIQNTYAATSSTNAADAAYYPYRGYVYTESNGTNHYTDLQAINSGRLYTPEACRTGYTYNEKWGSFTFGATSTNYMYMSGGVSFTDLVMADNVATGGFTLNYNGYYLAPNLNYNGLRLINDQALAGVWRKDSSNRVYITHSGRNYYITGTSAYSLTLTTSTTDVFKLASPTGATSNLTCDITTGSGNDKITTTYYIYYNNGNLGVGTNTTNRPFTVTNVTNRGNLTPSSTKHVVYDYNDNNTYIPLSVIDGENGDYEVSDRNVGYIVSGTNGDKTNGPDYNIRISQYNTTDLSNSYNSSWTNIYTVNNSGDQVSLSTDVEDNDGFERFSYVKQKMLNELSTRNGKIYGLHFMNASIDTHNIVPARYVSLNDEEHRNYDLLANSIDFELELKAVVNFMGGTYYSGNNAFMSLHEVFRDSSNNITSEKEIIEIYSDGIDNHSVVYKYADNSFSIGYNIDNDGARTTNLPGSSSSSLPTGSSFVKVFESKWIKKNSGLVDDAAYYFEFPMNKGEYAFGSVDGGTGAYLMYLDIAANKKNVFGTEYAEKVIYTTKSYVTPFGVALLSTTNDEVNNFDSTIAIAIKSYLDTLGIVLNAKDENTNMQEVDVTTSYMSSITPTYSSMLVSLTDGNGANLAVTPTTTSVKTINRTTYYEAFDDATYVTIIENGVRTIKKYDPEGNELTLTNSELSYYQNLTRDDGLAPLNNVIYKFTYTYVNSDTVAVDFVASVDYENKTLVSYAFTFTTSPSTVAECGLKVYITQLSDGYLLTINDYQCNVLYEVIIPTIN